ncbi:MAG: glucose-6-phosphate dehydrogenase [Armatimonadetes bacterium]|nr:glucose-6-phosphate dehydrogenase [Armatimonadota bacterium]
MMESTTSMEPTAFIIFGASGDLAWRKLGPALYNLHLDGWLPGRFAIIGADRKAMSDDVFRSHLRDGIGRFSRQDKTSETDWGDFASHLSFVETGTDGAGGLQTLTERLEEIDKTWGVPARRIFYMAVPPSAIGAITGQIGAANLSQDRERARVVVEKPIGYDLGSARALNRTLGVHFEERQIFRIDHYLGKETVQNILAFRFANPIFEPIWNRRYVDHMTITVAEAVGVEHRGGYYEHTGALRDMVQNHLLQLLCLTAMEPPVAFDADEIRSKKADVLRAIRPIRHEDVHLYTARGQYGPGWISGQQAAGYRQEPEVAPDSRTETFAALKLLVDNWRWQGVPFYLRTGKRLPFQASEISVRFRSVPHNSFPAESAPDGQPARLVICIQPEEGIVIKFQAKQPGPRMRLRQVGMRFSYCETFQKPSPDAYETLLWDVMTGDATLFMREDQVEAAWSLLMPVLEVWQENPPVDFPNHPAGTWGPESAEILIARDGRSWLLPTRLGDEENCPD